MVARTATRTRRETPEQQAKNPAVLAAAMKLLQQQGVALVQPIVPPVGPVANVTDDNDEDAKPNDLGEVAPDVLAMSEQETDAATRDPGLASQSQVGNVPDPTDAPELGDTPPRNDAKDQTSAVPQPKGKVISDTEDKERYKLLFDRIVLSGDDKKIGRDTARTYIEQEFGEGGRSQLAAALEKQTLTMSQTAYQFVLRAAHNSYVPLIDAATGLPAKDADDEPINILGEDFLAWYDKIVLYAEEQCRKEYRKSHAGVDLEKASVVFGTHWMQLKSNVRRSIKAGFDPYDFENCTSYQAASKKPRKKSGAAGQTTTGSANGAKIVLTDPSQPAVLDDYVAAMHPAIGAPLAQLIAAAKATSEVDATTVGQIIHNALMAIKALSIKTGDTANPLPQAA